MSEPVEMQAGDLVLVSRAGLYVAWVRRVSARQVAIEPCDPAIPDSRIRKDEV